MSKLDMAVNNLALQCQRLALLNPHNQIDTKHARLYAEFGYPESLDFAQYYTAFCRVSPANAAVSLIASETWQDYPTIESNDVELPQTKWVKKWYSKLKEADKRNLVGRYSAVLIQYKDGEPWENPVDTAILGRLKENAIHDIIPCWEAQLTPCDWFTDPNDWENYGKVKSWMYNEGTVGDCDNPRMFTVHPDRVLIVAEGSEDGNPLSGVPVLRAGFNNLVNSQKMAGAVAESFFKNAARQLVYKFDKETDLGEMADEMGLDNTSELMEKINSIAEMLNRGFDSSAAVKGGDIAPLVSAVPDPSQGWNINAQEFSASVRCPMRKLYGSEEGKQAADQDSKAFAQYCMSRRRFWSDVISGLLRKWVEFGIIQLPDDFAVDWSDLLKPSLSEKLDMIMKMAEINEKMAMAGGLVFTDNEMRELAEYAPLADSDKGLPPIDEPTTEE